MKDLVEMMEEGIEKQEVECPFVHKCDNTGYANLSFCNQNYMECCYYSRFALEKENV